jgi:hypothetical protein
MMTTFCIISKVFIGSRSNHNVTFLRRFHGSFWKLELINEINSIYNSSDVWRERGVLPAEIHAMVSRIHEGYDSFHPKLVYKAYKYGGEGMSMQEHFTLERHDEQGYCCARRPLINAGDWPCVSVPSLPVDVLLFKALANILMREFLWRRNNLPRRLTHYNEMVTYHERFWNGKRGVNRIICVDLSHSIHYVSTERLWGTLKCLHNMDVISHILNQFLSLPIYNADTNLQIPHSNCIPLIGELSDVLLHIFFQYQFDSEVLSRYEGVLYTRWDTNVLLASTCYDSYRLESYEIRDILRHVNLSGFISVIERGGDTEVNPEKSELFLSSDGDVSVLQVGEGEIDYDRD